MFVVRKIYDIFVEMLKKCLFYIVCYGDMIEVDIYCVIREVDILKVYGYVY